MSEEPSSVDFLFSWSVVNDSDAALSGSTRILIPLYHFLYHRILFLMIQNYLNHHCRYYHVCAYCVILIDRFVII